MAMQTPRTTDVRRIAAWAAVAIAGLPLYFVLPRLVGMALGARDPTGEDLNGQVAAILAYPNVYGSLALLSLVVGVSFIVLALALHERLRAAAPFPMRLAAVAGVLGGAFFLLAGAGPITTARWLADVHAQDPAAAVALYVTNQSITDRQTIVASLFLGVFMLVASVVGARAGLFSRAFSYVGVAAGAASVLPVFLPALWMGEVLMIVAWAAWLAVLLFRGSGRAAAGLPEAAPEHA